MIFKNKLPWKQRRATDSCLCVRYSIDPFSDSPIVSRSRQSDIRYYDSPLIAEKKTVRYPQPDSPIDYLCLIVKHSFFLSDLFQNQVPNRIIIKHD
jgi:hypothetical protein